MTNPPDFRRGLHLALAVLGLAGLTYVSRLHWTSVEWLGGEWPWDGSDGLLFHIVHTLPAFSMAWLAFAVFDTKSDVQIISRDWTRDWRKLGWPVWTLFALFLGHYVVFRGYGSAAEIQSLVDTYYYYYWDDFGGIGWGWLIAATLFAAAGEEVLFRGLLQPALEGYTNAWVAVFVQALIFAWIHGFAYQVGFGHVLGGLLYGLAFMRTRSLLAPFVLHAGGNLVHAALFAPTMTGS